MNRLPLGIQTFSEIIEDKYLYVDKTQQIAELIQAGKYVFLSRPRRFGKSLLVSALSEIFSGNQALFHGLYIHDKIEWESYPVISIDFSGISYDDEEVFKTSLSSFLDNVAAKHDIILSTTFVKDKFAELINKIHDKTNKKVVVLIDEYDKPIVEYVDDIEKAKKNREVLRNFFGVLKYSDAFLRFVFLTGVSKFSRVSIFSDLNNLRDITLSKKFATLLGYSQAELESYFDKHIQDFCRESGMKKEELLAKIKTWYNGYSWNAKDRMYNPFAILNLFAEQCFSNYWFASGTPAFLMKLIKEKKIEACDFENKKLSEIVFDSYDIEKMNVFALLFQTGYLTIIQIDKKARTLQYILDYPNFEVKEAFITYLFESFTENGLEDIQPTAEDLYACLQRQDLDGFMNIIRALFAKIPYRLHIEQEAYYHSLFYMILVLAGIEIDLEVLTDKGRIDGVLALADKIYLIEFKYGKAGTNMDSLINKALEQIKTKNYGERFLNESRPRHFLGVGFAGKKIGYRLSTEAGPIKQGIDNYAYSTIKKEVLKTMLETKIWPEEEMVHEDEFTDRVELLRELDQWVKAIGRMGSWSTAVIAPRRIGKTVLLDRLVNTVFFKPENQVAPFYFKMTREKRILKDFLLEYATTFFRQYLAYCEQDAALFNNKDISLEKLLTYKTTHKAGIMAQEYIQSFLERYEEYGDEDALMHWDAFICVPERLGSHSGTRVAVIIDEFQDMKFYIYDMPQELFSSMDSKGRLNGPGAINLLATYDRQAQSRKAPMLVSGSAVTLIFRTVMGGPLGGRFDFMYVKPLSIPDGAALLHNTLKYYASGSAITPELALYASAQTGGHPYYLYCLATSKYKDKGFGDEKAIDQLIRYEIENGKIFGFWQTHFDENRKYINADDDLELGRKIIYYFTQYNNQPVDIKAIARKLSVPKTAVEQKIEKLYMANLVYRSAARYYTFNDICLMRFIKFVYQQDLEGIDQIDLSQQNSMNTLKGKFLEMVVEVSIMKFNHELMPGRWFGKTGEIEVPLFQLAKTMTVKGAKTPSFQIDVFGKEKMRNKVWLCECKYTKTAMDIKQVKKLESAAQVLIQAHKEEGRAVPEIHLWLVSAGGFTKEALTYASARADIYASDYEGINSLFKAYGSNYSIPQFAAGDN